MLSISSQNVWSLSWILKAEEGWGYIEISTKAVIDRREEGGGWGGGVKRKIRLPAVIVLLGNNVCGQTEFLIGAVKLS